MIDNSKKFIDEMNLKSEKALVKIGLLAEGYAKLQAPVDTGRLRSSITFATHTDHSGGGPEAVPEDFRLLSEPEENTMYIGTNVKYAEAVEFNDGAHHVTGKAHFLRDSISKHKKTYEKIYNDILKEQ